jgi:hypothetical protein
MSNESSSEKLRKQLIRISMIFCVLAIIFVSIAAYLKGDIGYFGRAFLPILILLLGYIFTRNQEKTKLK